MKQPKKIKRTNSESWNLFQWLFWQSFSTHRAFRLWAKTFVTFVQSSPKTPTCSGHPGMQVPAVESPAAPPLEEESAHGLVHVVDFVHDLVPSLLLPFFQLIALRLVFDFTFFAVILLQRMNTMNERMHGTKSAFYSRSKLAPHIFDLGPKYQF